jgi:hypothetical protein
MGGKDMMILALLIEEPTWECWDLPRERQMFYCFAL